MHPPLERLDAFGRGDLSEDEAATIEDHLAACPDCLEKLAGGVGDDALIGLVRAAGQATYPIRSGMTDARSWVPPDVPTGYEILEPIGRGGMGVVYKANQRALGRIVALKQIQAGPDADAQELARFRIEALAAARVRHPNIVQVYDVGLRDGSPFLAMELVEGGSLAARLRHGPLPPREAARLAGVIARAVDHAHRAGVLHRDLKPGNILLAPDGTPKVADFGLAKWLDGEGQHTRTGAVLGTPSYMAPEQAEGQAIGRPVDIYALGAILYECLTGRPPFQAAIPLETLEQVRSCDPPAPSRLQPNVPRDLQTICLKCLEKAPRRRYATAADLAADLDRFLEGKPIAARPVGATERVLKWARRRPSQAALAGLGLASMVGALGGLLAHQARLRVEVDRAGRAAKEAHAQRSLADANYREARAAIQRILDRSNDPRFRGIPRSSELRQVQAEAALGFYDRILAAAESPDPEVRLDTALALREAANLQIGLGQHEPAERKLLRSLRLLDALARGRDDDAVLLRERMTTWLKLGVLLMGRDHDRSLEALRAALALAERQARAQGSSWRNRADLAWCEDNIGSSLLMARRPGDAEPHYLRAAGLRRALLRERPDDAGGRVELASTLVNLGLVRMDSRPDLVEADYAEAAALFDKAVETSPDRLEYIVPLANLLNNWGNLAARRGQPDLALERHARGLGLVEPIMRSQPALSEPRLAALNLRGSRANLLGSLGRHAEAVADWDHVLALNDSPAEETTYRLLRLLALLKSGDHARGIVEIERLTRPAPGGTPLSSPADLYNVACFYALASAAARRDAALPAEQRERLAQTYAGQALDWLRRCGESGFWNDPGNRDHARVDPDLQPIRDRDEFARILGDDAPTTVQPDPPGRKP
jgi:tetratricopeptide (TPR) repeat protein